MENIHGDAAPAVVPTAAPRVCCTCGHQPCMRRSSRCQPEGYFLCGFFFPFAFGIWPSSHHFPVANHISKNTAFSSRASPASRGHTMPPLQRSISRSFLNIWKVSTSSSFSRMLVTLSSPSGDVTLSSITAPGRRSPSTACIKGSTRGCAVLKRSSRFLIFKPFLA